MVVSCRSFSSPLKGFVYPHVVVTQQGEKTSNFPPPVDTMESLGVDIVEVRAFLVFPFSCAVTGIDRIERLDFSIFKLSHFDSLCACGFFLSTLIFVVV